MPPAPLPGSHVWIRRRRWRVDRTRIDRRTVRLDVSDRDRRLTVFTPYDVPGAAIANRRPVRVRPQEGLARLAHLVARPPHGRLPTVAIDARVDIWPHQLEPLLAIAAGHRRVLLADEVGLGKTIQAGLVLAYLLSRQPSFHALIVVPAALQAQWTTELRDRFALDARPVEAMLAALDSDRRRTGWLPPGIWIGSIDYIKQVHVFDAVPLQPWDLVVVDEAHTAAGRSDRQEAVDELGRRARHLMLLTATPHDGDAVRFGRLIGQGALPTRNDALRVFRRTRADLSLPEPRHVRWCLLAPTASLTHLFDALATFDRMMLARARPGRHDTVILLLSVIRKRALSTMAALDRTLARRIDWLDSGPFGFDLEWTQPPLDFGDDELDDSERMTLTVDVGVPRALERTWLKRLRTLASAAMRGESKLTWIRRVADRTREPFVLFTEFRHSLEAVERVLRGVRRLAVVHGGLSDLQRRQAIQRFLGGEASVLLTTDVCSQGLNLQTAARWVINLEVPWNPLRIEQRIGRLDRIGQRRVVHATLLAGRHGAEDGVLGGLARRTLAVHRTTGRSSFDTLAPPPHLAVASAIVCATGLPAHSLTDVSLEPCVEYAQSAKAAGRLLTARRRLAQHWQGLGGTRPCSVRLARRVAPFNGVVVVIAVPLVDHTGETVERLLAAFRLPAGQCPAPVPTGLAKALAARVSRRLDARRRRLMQVRRATAARRIATERAIATHLHALRSPEHVQLGLFGRRAGVAFVEARVLAAEGDRDAATRVRLENDHARIEIGDPTIEWIGGPR